MKFIPILFSADMVNAILNGTKTQTRRVVNAKSGLSPKVDSEGNVFATVKAGGYTTIVQPKAQKGDIFWVRENWAALPQFDHIKPSNLPQDTAIAYKANQKDSWDGFKTRPSIFMPKWACRLFLEVVDVRIERLHDISYKDAREEGVKSRYPAKGDKRIFKRYMDYTKNSFSFISSILSFNSLWIKINGSESYNSNPWVWVYEFKVVDKPENFK